MVGLVLTVGFMKSRLFMKCSSKQICPAWMACARTMREIPRTCWALVPVSFYSGDRILAMPTMEIPTTAQAMPT